MNFIIFVVFGAGLGLGNAQGDPALRLYFIYAYSLLIIPVIAHFLRKNVKAESIKKKIMILSFSYFIWGYIVMELVKIPLEPLYNYDKYAAKENISITVMEIDDKGIVDDKRLISIKMDVLNKSKTTYLARMDLKKVPNSYIGQSGCSGKVRRLYEQIRPGQNVIIFDCFIWVLVGSYYEISLSQLGGNLILQEQPKTEIYFPFVK